MKQQTAIAKKGGRRFKLVTETVSELRKVVWLTRRETIYLTTLVLVVAVSAGIALGLIDFGFSHLVHDIFLGR